MILGPSSPKDENNQGIAQPENPQKTSLVPQIPAAAGTSQGQDEIRGASASGGSHSQPRQRRGSIARGRARSLSITGSEESSQDDTPKNPVVCLQGAGVNLPAISEDAVDTLEKTQKDSSSYQEKKFLLPSLLMNAQRRSSQWSGGMDLQVSGQDMKLPPSKAPNLPNTDRRVSWQSSLQTLSELPPEDLGAEETGRKYRNKRKMETVLLQILECHSVGIALKISRKLHRPGARQAVALFHCENCLEAWQDTGQIPDNCPFPNEPVSGPELLVNKTTFNFIKKIWKTHLMPHYGEVKEEDIQKTIDELKKTFATMGESMTGLMGRDDSDYSFSDFSSGSESELDFNSSDEYEIGHEEHKIKQGKKQEQFSEDEFILPGRPQSELAGTSYNEMLVGLVEDFGNAEETRRTKKQQKQQGETKRKSREEGGDYTSVKTSSPARMNTYRAFSRSQSRGYSVNDQYDQHARSPMGKLGQTAFGEKESKRQQKKKDLNKPVIRNPAVKNKTGKPETEKGHLKSGRFQTPSSRADTNKYDSQRSEVQETPMNGRESSLNEYSQARGRSSLSRTGRRSSMAADGRYSALPNEKIMDGEDMLNGEVPSRAEYRRNTQTPQAIRRGMVTPTGMPRDAGKAHHSRQIEDGLQNFKGEKRGKGRKSSLVNTWPSTDAAFRMSSGPRAPSSLAQKSSMFTQSTEESAQASPKDEGESPSVSREERAKALVAPLPQIVRNREDSVKRPVAEVKPSISKPAIPSERTSSTESDTESEESSPEVSRSRKPLIIPDFGGLSSLSFTPAFTFSFYPNLPYPKPAALSQIPRKKKGQAKNKASSKKKGLKALPAQERITTETAKKPKTDVAKMARKMKQKVENPKPIAKYVKKLPALDKQKAKKNQTNLNKKKPLPVIKKTEEGGSAHTSDSLRRSVLIHGQVHSQRSMETKRSIHSDKQIHRSRHSNTSQTSKHKSTRAKKSSHHTKRKHSKPASIVKVAYQHGASGSTIEAKFSPVDGREEGEGRQSGQEGRKDATTGFQIEFDPMSLHEAESVIIRVTDYV